MTGVHDTTSSGPRSEISLIAAREIRERMAATSYRILTGLLAVLIIALAVIVRIAGGGDADDIEIGVADPVPGFAEVLQDASSLVDREVTVTVIDADDSRRAIEDGDIDAAVLVAERSVMYASDINPEIQAVVQHAWSGVELRQALIDTGVNPPLADELTTAEPLAATTLDGDDDDDDAPADAALLTGLMAGILLFISLQVFGNYALTGVAEEKSTAVVELLLVRVRASQLLAGKLIGIGAAALLQIVVAVLAGLVALPISGADIPSEIWSALPTTLVWYVGGFALYATLYAFAGSLVSRQEDAQAAAAPITTVLIGAYVLVYIVGVTPESGASRIASVLPPTAPFLMPIRMAAGAASVVEIAAALVLLFGSAFVGWRLCGRVYEKVLLRRGTRIPWREALALRSDS